MILFKKKTKEYTENKALFQKFKYLPLKKFFFQITYFLKLKINEQVLFKIYR